MKKVYRAKKKKRKKDEKFEKYLSLCRYKIFIYKTAIQKVF